MKNPAAEFLRAGVTNVRRCHSAGVLREVSKSSERGLEGPSVCMIKLIATRSITPYRWVHPTEER